MLSVNDNREFRIFSTEYSELDVKANDELQLANAKSIDDLIYQYCSDLFDVLPAVTLKDILEFANVQTEARFAQVYTLLNERKALKKKLKLCGNYSKAYLFYCDFFGMSNTYQEVIWDANVIYGKNGLREFSLNDFDYVNTKFVNHPFFLVLYSS
jgi:hypothetical protein